MGICGRPVISLKDRGHAGSWHEIRTEKPSPERGSQKRANWPLLRTNPGAAGTLLATEALSLEFPQEGHATLGVRVGREGKCRGQKNIIGRFCNLIPGSAHPLRSRRGQLTLRLVRVVELTEQGIPWGKKQNQNPDRSFVARVTSTTWTLGSFSVK